MSEPTNNISFGKQLGNLSFNGFNGIRKSDIDKKQQSLLDEGIFSTYDTNKDQILDKTELAKLQADLLSFAGDNGQIGKREAKRFIQEKLGVHKDFDYNREDLQAIINQIAVDKDNIQNAYTTQDGVTHLEFKPDEEQGIRSGENIRVINGEPVKIQDWAENADLKVTTNYNDDGSKVSVTEHKTVELQGAKDYRTFNAENQLTELRRERGAVTNYYEITGNDSMPENSRLLRKVTNNGNLGTETVEYTYNDDGTITETTISSATPDEKTVVVKDAYGNMISTTTVTSDVSTEISGSIRTERDAEGNIVRQVQVDANGAPISYTHQVQPGDTWYGIVQAKYGITDHATTMAVVRELRKANNYTGSSIPASINLPPSVDLSNGTKVNLKNIQASVNPIHNGQNSRLTPLSSAEQSITIDSKFNTPISNVSSSTGPIAETGGGGYYTVDDSGRINAYYPTWSAYQAEDEQIWITRDTHGNISTYTVNTYDASGNPTGGIEYDGEGNFRRRWVNVGFSADNNGQNYGWTHKVFYDADGNYENSYTKAQWEQGENV